MLKSKSQDSPLSSPESAGPSRCHFYEEIQPKLTYVDIDIGQNRKLRERTAK